MKEVSREQGFQLVSVLMNNADWLQVPADMAQRIIDNPVGSGSEFTRFLANGGHVITAQPNVIPINRATPFNPTEFLGEGWSIWKGPADGDGLSGNEEQDEKSLALTELDLSKIQLATCLNKGEDYIKGEERLKRLKKGNFIRLDAQIFLTLWQNQHLIPEAWKEKINSHITFIYFHGTTLRSPRGDRSALCLYWFDGGWYWDCDWLGGVWRASAPSAVLAS